MSATTSGWFSSTAKSYTTRKRTGSAISRYFLVPLVFSLICGSVAQESDSGTIAIKCEKILTITKGVVNNGVIVVRDGKIVSVGTEIPKDARVIDAASQWALPGFVDLHCHIGGMMSDINEMGHPNNPELGTRPTIDPHSDALKMAIAGGVTTVLYIPGSGTNISGFGTLMKTGGGNTIDDLILRFPGAMKVAQAWNPEREAGDLGATRTGMWWMLRRFLDKGKAYHQAWTDYEKGLTKTRPEKKNSLEMMRGLFRKDYPIIVHTADARDIMGTVRIFNDEYSLDVILSHGEDNSYEVAEEIAKRGIHTDVGPRIYDPPFWSFEVKFVGIPAEYYNAGVKKLSINTDSPVVPQEDLVFQAAMAVRYGLPEKVALEGITIAPARAIKMDKRVGSLEAGKDADIVLWTGNPLDARNHVTLVMINGKVVYDASKDGRRY